MMSNRSGPPTTVDWKRWRLRDGIRVVQVYSRTTWCTPTYLLSSLSWWLWSHKFGCVVGVWSTRRYHPLGGFLRGRWSWRTCTRRVDRPGSSGVYGFESGCRSGHHRDGCISLTVSQRTVVTRTNVSSRLSNYRRHEGVYLSMYRWTTRQGCVWIRTVLSLRSPPVVEDPLGRSIYRITRKYGLTWTDLLVGSWGWESFWYGGGNVEGYRIGWLY